MPSRPLSTYMIYYLEQKDRVAAENPGLEMTQVRLYNININIAIAKYKTANTQKDMKLL